MIEVSEDEAFVMLAMFTQEALSLFAILFVVGIFSGFLIDVFVKNFNISTCENCSDKINHPQERSFKHYLIDHI